MGEGGKRERDVSERCVLCVLCAVCCVLCARACVRVAHLCIQSVRNTQLLLSSTPLGNEKKERI